MDFLKDFNVPETVGLKIMNKYNNKTNIVILNYTLQTIQRIDTIIQTWVSTYINL